MIDYQLEDTVFVPFTTRAFATGIPTVLAGTPAIDIYEDATATPIVTGETLAVSLNSVVGFNMITVTATAATGFNVGGHYTAIIQAGTVGGVSVVGEVVGEFTIDNSAAAKDLANGTDGLGAIKGDTAEIGTAGAGLTNINLPNQTMDIVGSITGNLSGSVGSVTGAVGSVTAIDTTAGAVDNVTLVATTTTNTDMVAEAPTAVQNRAEMDSNSTQLAQIVQMLGHHTTIATLASQTSFTLTAGSADDDAYNGWACMVIDASTATQLALGKVSDYTGSTKTITLSVDPAVFTMAATDIVILLPGFTTETQVVDLSATAEASVVDATWDEDIVTAHGTADTAGLLLRVLGAVISQRTNNATLNALLGVVDTASFDIAYTIWDEVLTAAVHNDPTSAGRRLRLTSEIVQVESAVDDPGAAATTTVFNTDLTEPDDHWNDAILIFTSGILLGQSRTVQDYANTNGQITLDEALTSIPADNVTFSMRSDHVHPITQIADGIWDEAMAGHTTADTAGLVMNEWQDGGRLDLLLDAAVALMTTQLAEAYAADGVAPTPAQALFLIQQMVSEFAISGTTLTAKKLDGSTTAATFTLDDGTTPTSITRAT